MPSKRERVKDLVRKLDAINAEQEKLVREVRRIEREIDEIIGETPGEEDAPESGEHIVPAHVISFSKFTKAGLVFNMVKAGVLPDIPALALKLYGENTAKTRNRARSVIYFLEKQQQMIRKTATGNYEAVAVEDA